MTHSVMKTVSRCRLSAAPRVRDRVEDSVLQGFLSRYDWGPFKWAGFSLLAQSQLPFTLLFARALRSVFPGLRTVAGGPYITEMVGGLVCERETFDHFDFLVVHEGESGAVTDCRRRG